MSMYTEFHFNVELKQEGQPWIVRKTLEFMLADLSGKADLNFIPPEHPLFETPGWRYMLIRDSYYFDADTYSTLRWDGISKSYYLCIRCNLKNYGQEIQKFIDWIMPYIDAPDGEFLGFYRYEESQDPTLVHCTENREVV